ncbi:hypothetical protein F7261_03215 [Salmonella enterica]|nr:hypothetical protein [Salmonella enterica]ECD4595550.1 hypothetical protein [Salmonella enterica subsp. enterica serovar Waycross]ECI7157645.1 hypothetical protein [Salmonella enterica subsp. enterica]EHA9141329.1 hypothetical protein [Salmonella enterica subsp. enterica serovar Bochum]EAS1152850.1 hypothetical protein [Salmonella enterica]
MSLLRKFAWKPAALLPDRQRNHVELVQRPLLRRQRPFLFFFSLPSCSKFNLIQAPHFLLFLAGDYAFSRIWITYEYIDKTIRSAIITLIYNMANLSFRAPGA